MRARFPSENPGRGRTRCPAVIGSHNGGTRGRCLATVCSRQTCSHLRGGPLGASAAPRRQTRQAGEGCPLILRHRHHRRQEDRVARPRAFARGVVRRRATPSGSVRHANAAHAAVRGIEARGAGTGMASRRQRIVAVPSNLATIDSSSTPTPDATGRSTLALKRRPRVPPQCKHLGWRFAAAGDRHLMPPVVRSPAHEIASWLKPPTQTLRGLRVGGEVAVVGQQLPHALLRPVADLLRVQGRRVRMRHPGCSG